MNNQSAESFFDSLKGRIRLAAFALAVVQCLFGAASLAAYFFLSVNPILVVTVCVGGIAVATLAFGYWLSVEITRPIESLTLLARSLERSPSAALPSTTGSKETDELLNVLQRSSRQMQNLITVMDDVAAGRTETAFIPLENADRLSVSFQRLVSKVTDSITAKKELDDLLAAISALSIEAAQARQMHLDLEFRTTNERIKGIGDVLKFLAVSLQQSMHQARAAGSRTQQLIGDARRTMTEAIERREARVASITSAIGNGSATRLREIVLQMISHLESWQRISNISDIPSDQENRIGHLGNLKSRILEVSRKIRKFRDRSSELNSFARGSFEMARRSNLIAINTTLQDKEIASETLDIIVDELSLISERNSALSRDISAFYETLTADLADMENILTAANDEVGEAIRLAMAEDSKFSEAEKIYNQIQDIVKRLDPVSFEAAEEVSKLVSAIELLSDSDSEAALIRTADSHLQSASGIIGEFTNTISSPEPSPRFTGVFDKYLPQLNGNGNTQTEPAESTAFGREIGDSKEIS